MSKGRILLGVDDVTEVGDGGDHVLVCVIVERVQVTPTGADITLRTEGLATLLHDLQHGAEPTDQAA